MRGFFSKAIGRVPLRAGEWVVVKSKAAILATLDADGRVDGLPFQPEMLTYCGERMRVLKVAHKTCDNIHKTGGRRMSAAVHLEGARCSGDFHGGCQADCVFFWKQAWLDLKSDSVHSTPSITPDEVNRLDALIRNKVRATFTSLDDPQWVCQTTALYDATTPLAWWDLRQYILDVITRNHSVWHMIKLMIFAGYRKVVALGVGYRVLVGLFNWFQKLRGRNSFPSGHGSIPDGDPTPEEVLNLQPGEWVEVLPQSEILKTISESGYNRGMRYDLEMSKYCGKRFKVQMRVDRLISEQTGKMLRMKSPCIQLEDVFCRAECTTKRLGCPRASNTYWREIWLRRAADGPNSKRRSTTY